MKKNIAIPNHIEMMLKCILCISFPALSLFWLRNCEKGTMILSLIVAFILSVVIIRFLFKDFKKINILYFIISSSLAFYIMNIYYQYHLITPFINEYYNFSLLNLQIISFCAIPAMIFLIYFLSYKLTPSVFNFFRSFTNTEKKFFLVFTFISFITTFLLYYFTSAFYYAEGIYWDIIYTSDSSGTYFFDTYFNINSPLNDPAKQPLFGIFSLPFAIIARILSQICFFLPNSYAVFLTTIQLGLIAIILIMLGRLIGTKHKILFYSFFLCTFSFISFAFVLEQYIISLFYVILVIYSYFYSKKKINYAYLGGVGTVVTSGILLPFLSKSNDWKVWLKNSFICLFVFILIIVIFGQLPVIFLFFNSVIDQLNNFAGEGLTFSDKLMQYLNFVKCLFLAIPAHTLPTIAAGPFHMSYYVDSIYHYSKVGILILLLCLISLIILRKNKMVIFSFLWIIFSFIILCLVGWGTAENGLNLYSLYFGWAFIILIYLLIDTLIKNDKIKQIIIILICLGLLLINIPEFINIIKFGLVNYPI